jgi:hypothetical protein
MFPGIRIVYIAFLPFYDVDVSQDFPDLTYILTRYGHQLECLWINLRRYGDCEGDDFPSHFLLPRLKHFHIGYVKKATMTKILKNTPNLEFFSTASGLVDWSQLPQGLKILNGTNIALDGPDSLLRSAAVESLEEIVALNISAKISGRNINFKNLKILTATIYSAEYASVCLSHLAKITQFASLITVLQLTLHTDEALSGVHWKNVFLNCFALKKLSIRIFPELLETSSGFNQFQDDIAVSLATYVTLLEDLDVPFGFSSRGLEALSSLKHLKHFRHFYKFERGDDIFTEEALINFLERSCQESLRSYRLDCLHYCLNDPIYFIVSYSFIEALDGLCKKNSLTWGSDKWNSVNNFVALEDGRISLNNLELEPLTS